MVDVDVLSTDTLLSEVGGCRLTSDTMVHRLQSRDCQLRVALYLLLTDHKAVCLTAAASEDQETHGNDLNYYAQSYEF
jgi:hypothetical protein